jgi:hypothetical protein
MKRLTIIAALSMLLLAIGATAAQAANQHFVTGFDAPTCTVTGTTVNCTGTEIAGVGNNNAVATLNVVASGIVDCNNPGDNRNNPIESHETTFEFSATSGVLESKNGRLVVLALSATAPTSLTAAQEAELCPNPNWEAELREGSVTIDSWSYSIVFLDRDGNPILPAFYSISR